MLIIGITQRLDVPIFRQAELSVHCIGIRGYLWEESVVGIPILFPCHPQNTVLSRKYQTGHICGISIFAQITAVTLSVTFVSDKLAERSSCLPVYWNLFQSATAGSDFSSISEINNKIITTIRSIIDYTQDFTTQRAPKWGVVNFFLWFSSDPLIWICATTTTSDPGHIFHFW